MKWDRRKLLRNLSLFGGGLLTGNILSTPGKSQTNGNQKYLHIYLRGGCNFFWAIDPPTTGSKATSGGYSSNYREQTTTTVTGKPNLILGEGFAPAADGFAAIPTAFINGMQAGQVVHDVGQRYAYTGKLEFSVTRGSPAIAASLGTKTTSFPAHLMLGTSIPLGSTLDQYPPLLTKGSIAGGINLPFSDAEDRARISATLEKLNDIYYATLNETELASLQGFRNIRNHLTQFDNQGYVTKTAVTTEIQERYGNSNIDFASCLLALKSGLTKNITLTAGNFDTHFDEDTQKSEQQAIARGLGLLLQDLVTTADPDDATKTLSQTTTIVVNSEFGRTPIINTSGGSDHWHTTSTIVMGQYVRDNVVIGASDNAGEPLGWSGGTTTTATTDTEIRPEHIFRSILLKFGHTDLADALADRGLDDAFV